MLYIFGAQHGAAEMLEDTAFYSGSKQISISDISLVEDKPQKENVISTLEAYGRINESDYGVISAWSPKWKETIDNMFDSEWISAVSPGATVFTDMPVGLNIRRNATIASTATVGRHVRINFGSLIGQDAAVGDYCFIGVGAAILGNARLGKGSILYSNSVILTGISVGNNSVIGAGSTVTKDIPDNVVAYGTPCRAVKENK